MDKRSARNLLLLVLLFLGSGGLLAVFMPREPLLLERAIRVEPLAVGSSPSLSVPDPPPHQPSTINNHTFEVVEKCDPNFITVVDHVEIREYGGGKEAQLLQKHPIQLPFKAVFLDRQFSPQGDRIVWLLVPSAPAPSFSVWISRYIPAIRPSQTLRVGFWVSRIDGTQMHELGYTPLPIPFGSDMFLSDLRNGVPDHITWTTNGKQLSFQYHHTRYTVPAD
ncbi:MAG: hypothetical protein JWN14_973 [Chthonomonadales bacterium]|nr:hypothetical protein [Chthonomonadales bacterium]